MLANPVQALPALLSALETGTILMSSKSYLTSRRNYSPVSTACHKEGLALGRGSCAAASVAVRAHLTRSRFHVQQWQLQLTDRGEVVQTDPLGTPIGQAVTWPCFSARSACGSGSSLRPPDGDMAEQSWRSSSEDMRACGSYPAHGQALMHRLVLEYARLVTVFSSWMCEQSLQVGVTLSRAAAGRLVQGTGTCVV